MIRDLETVVRNLVMSGKLGFTIEDLIMSGNTSLTINDLFESKLDDEDPYGPKNSCLSWFGGKYAFRERIAALSPPDICINSYIEVFGGAGHHILYKKPMFKAQKGDKNLNESKEVYNDLNGGLYTVFKVIQDDDKYERLCDMLYKTPYDREVFESCKDWESREDDVELAWAFIVRTLQSVNMTGGFAPAKEIRGKGENAYRRKVKMFEDKTRTYLRALKEKVDSFIVENYDFEECIDKYDAEDAFFLLDPPYVHSTRSSKNDYDKEMSNEDHERLVDKLLNMKGYAMLCGYDNDIYKRLEDNGFQKVLLGYAKRSSSNTNRDEVKEEYVWLNYKTFDAILASFVCEEAISGFSSFGKRLKNKLITWDEVPECKDIEFTQKKDQATPATEDRISKLEEKFNITLPEGYAKFLMDFNGGYFNKKFSEKTELKPAYFFGILTKEHPLDLETQIDSMPQLRIGGGFIPIGVTTEDDFICLKVSKTLIPTVNDLASYEDVYGVEPIIAIFRKTGEVEYFKRSLQELFGDLYREYRGYKSVTSKKVIDDCTEVEEFSSEYCMSLVDEVNNSLCYLHNICKELLSELPKKDLKLLKKSFLSTLKERCNKQDFKSLKRYFLHAYKSSTEEFRSDNESLLPQLLLYLRDDGTKKATDKLFELSKIPKEDYSILLKNCLTLIKSKGSDLFDEDITLSIFSELLPGLSNETINSIKNIAFSFIGLSKEEIDSVEEIVNKVCYMHNLSKELLSELSIEDFNLLKDMFLSTLPVLALDEDLDDIEDFEDDIKMFSEVYNLPAKAFELYMKCVCLPPIVFDEKTVSVVKNIFFQLSRLPKEEYYTLLDKFLDLIKSGLSYLSKEEFIERIEVCLPLAICVLSKKVNINLKDLIGGGEIDLDEITNDDLESIYKDIDWVNLSIDDMINFIDVFLSIAKAVVKPSFINFTGTFISIVKSAIKPSLLEKEVELIEDIKDLKDIALQEFSKKDLDGIDEIIDKVCYMHSICKETLSGLSVEDFNLLKDMFSSMLPVLVFDEDEDIDEIKKCISLVYNLPTKELEFYLKGVDLPQIVSDEKAVSIIKNIFFQLSRLPKEEYSSFLDNCLCLIRSGLAKFSKEELIEYIGAYLLLTICVFSKKVNIDLDDLTEDSDIDLDDLTEDIDFESIIKDIDWVNLSIEEVISFIELFFSIAELSLHENELNLLEEVELLLERYPLWDDENESELIKTIIPNLTPNSPALTGEALLKGLFDGSVSKDLEDMEAMDSMLRSCIEELNEVYPEETTLKIIKEFLLTYNDKKVRREVIQDLNEYVHVIKSILSSFNY